MTLRNIALVELPFKHDMEGGDGTLSSYCRPLCFSMQFFFFNGEIIFKLLGMLKAYWENENIRKREKWNWGVEGRFCSLWNKLHSCT